jgi:hypothetical protein
MSRLPNPNTYPMTTMPKAKQFAYIYNTSSYTIQTDQDIPLDFNGPITDKIIHNNGSSIVIIKQTGLYKVSYVVTSDSSNNQVALAVNNRIVYDSLYGAESSFQNYGQTIIHLHEGDVLSLRNIDGVLVTPVTTYDVYTVINVSLILETMNYAVNC